MHATTTFTSILIRIRSTSDKELHAGTPFLDYSRRIYAALLVVRPLLARGVAESSCFMPDDNWFSVHKRNVLSGFLTPLSQHPEWRLLYLVSPWISEFRQDAGMSLKSLLRRLENDKAAAYVTTRPPIEDWHRRALDMMEASGRVGISLVKDLHTKLFCAETARVRLAMLGSANLTAKAASGIELGVLIRDVGSGQEVVRALHTHAGELFRMEGRTLRCSAKI